MSVAGEELPPRNTSLPEFAGVLDLVFDFLVFVRKPRDTIAVAEQWVEKLNAVFGFEQGKLAVQAAYRLDRAVDFVSVLEDKGIAGRGVADSAPRLCPVRSPLLPASAPTLNGVFSSTILPSLRVPV